MVRGEVWGPCVAGNEKWLLCGICSCFLFCIFPGEMTRMGFAFWVLCWDIEGCDNLTEEKRMRCVFVFYVFEFLVWIL